MEVYDKIAESWARYRKKPLEFVKDFLKGKKGRLLVAGCGSGRHSIYASKIGFEVYGFDSSFNMVKQIKNGHYVVADVRHIPFKDKVFDYGLCIAVLHHLRPDEIGQALEELKRVVKKSILVSVWRYDQKRFEGVPQETYIKWGKYKRYYYLYRPEEFKQKISNFFKFKDLSDKANIILEIFPEHSGQAMT